MIDASMSNASLMSLISTNTLKQAIQSNEEAVAQLIESVSALSSGEVSGTSSSSGLDIYA
ncbi:hypothetical protein [uncultured Campylobacter sp.]|uniref:hypothetical protein n=1 Tax=uncultured Campylobacter sp. TaxID=218934 RepID=UPI00263086EE|nr:hypothetical protein [uncultured Campylobacter sp.]